MAAYTINSTFELDEISLNALKTYFKTENEKAEERLSKAKDKIKTTFNHILSDYDYSEYESEQNDTQASNNSQTINNIYETTHTHTNGEKRSNPVKIGPDIISNGMVLPISGANDNLSYTKNEMSTNVNPSSLIKKFKNSIPLFHENDSEKQLQNSTLFTSSQFSSQQIQNKKEKSKNSNKEIDTNSTSSWSYTPVLVEDSDDDSNSNLAYNKSPAKSNPQKNIKSWIKNLSRLIPRSSDNDQPISDKGSTKGIPQSFEDLDIETKESTMTIPPIPVKANLKSILELSDVRCIREVQSEDKLAICSLNICPNGEWLTAGTDIGLILLWRFKFYKTPNGSKTEDYEDEKWLISDTPTIKLNGHTQRIIELSWSDDTPYCRLLSSSLDWFVRLWEPNSGANEVAAISCSSLPTTVSFHPKKKSIIFIGFLYFTVQVWKLQQSVDTHGSTKRVLHGNMPLQTNYETMLLHVIKVPYLITSMSTSPSGNLLAIGFIEGTVAVYDTKTLRLQYEVDCKNRRGKFAKGKKVTGMIWNKAGSRMLITTNDSRIRLLNSRDFTMSGKLKGHINEESLFKAEYALNERHVVCGSENGCIYLWNIQKPENYKFNWKKQKSTNESYESFKAFNEPLTSITVANQRVVDMIISHLEIRTHTPTNVNSTPKNMFNRSSTHRKDFSTQKFTSKLNNSFTKAVSINDEQPEITKPIPYNAWQYHEKLVITAKFQLPNQIQQTAYPCKNFVFVAGTEDGKIGVFINIGDTLKR